MEVRISTQEYEVVKDGVIIAAPDDIISFKFSDLEFKFKIYEKNDGNKEVTDKGILSEDKKSITYPIGISWSYLSTTFSDKTSVATYDEDGVKKGLYFSYAINGLKGQNISAIVFKYTLYSKIISDE